LCAFAVAIVGALVTDLGSWYQSLREPPWKPPDWLFGPAWTLIFGLTAMAGVSAWINAPNRAVRRRLIALFAINGALNVLWSLLFFRLHRPDWALAEVVFLWLSIAALILVLGQFSKAGAWLLIPYIAWVTFAAFLNLAVVRLNYPFSAT